MLGRLLSSAGAVIATVVYAAVFLFVSGLIKLRQMRASQGLGASDYLNTARVPLWWWVLLVGPPVAFWLWWLVRVRGPRP